MNDPRIGEETAFTVDCVLSHNTTFVSCSNGMECDCANITNLNSTLNLKSWGFTFKGYNELTCAYSRTDSLFLKSYTVTLTGANEVNEPLFTLVKLKIA